MISELSIDFVESIKEKYFEEKQCGEKNYNESFKFFNDFEMSFTLVTHNNLPFKVSQIYKLENKYGVQFNSEVLHKLRNNINSLL